MSYEDFDPIEAAKKYGGEIEEKYQTTTKDGKIVPVKNPPQIATLSSVADQEVKYIWEPYIPSKAITLLRAEAGAGKTYTGCAIGAAITQEFQPEGMPGIVHSTGNVLYFGAEDEAFIFKKRAVNCGANLDKFYICENHVSFDDMETIARLTKEAQAKLVIFDPMQAFIGAGVDLHRSNETRPVMDVVREFARDADCGVLILEHFSKDVKVKAFNRGLGSADITAAARSVISLFPHKDKQGHRVIFQVKSNMRWGAPVEVEIDDQGRFLWHGVCDDMTLEDADKNNGKSFTGNSMTAETHPAVFYAKAIVKAHPEGWRGTAGEFFQEGNRLTKRALSEPRALGMALSNDTKVLNEFNFLGICCHKDARKRYELYVEDDSFLTAIGSSKMAQDGTGSK